MRTINYSGLEIISMYVGSSGSEQFTGLTEGKYFLRIVSFDLDNGERYVLRRDINIGDHVSN